MAQPDHDTESQMADTAPDESGHDEARPLSDEGEPGRGSLATETVAGTVGGVVAGSLVGWGTAGIAAAGAAAALPLAGAVAAGGLIAVGGVTVARRLGVPVDQAAHGAGRAAAYRGTGGGPGRDDSCQGLQIRGHRLRHGRWARLPRQLPRSPNPRPPARHGRWARLPRQLPRSPNPRPPALHGASSRSWTGSSRPNAQRGIAGVPCRCGARRPSVPQFAQGPSSPFQRVPKSASDIGFYKIGVPIGTCR